MGEFEELANQLEVVLTDGSAEQSTLVGLLEQANGMRVAARDCVQFTTNLQNQLNAQVAALGQESETDAAGVVAVRTNLRQAAARAAQQLGECRLLALTAQRLIGAASERQQQLLTARLSTRGPALTTLVSQNLTEPLIWFEFARNFLFRDGGLLAQSTPILAGIPIVVALGALFGLLLRRRTLVALAGRQGTEQVTDGLIKSALATGARYAPYLIATLLLSSYFTVVFWGQRPLPFISVASYGLMLYFGLTASMRMLLAPAPPATSFLPLPVDLSRQLAQRLRVLAFLLLLGFLLFATLLAWELPEPQYLLARGIYVAFLVVNLIWVTWLTGRLFSSRRRRGPGLGVLLALVLLVALAADWLGFRNLTTFLMLGLTGTLLGLGLTWLIKRLLDELFQSIETGRYPWTRRLRSLLGFERDEYVPGLNGLRFVGNLLLLGALALWLLRIWGLSAASVDNIVQYITDGFSVAGIRIVPVRLVWALLMFALLLTFFRWFKRRLAGRWTANLRIDHGAREALVTTAGYVGAAISFLVMLAIAGIEFTNLAIVAGALSVGIGFGLQNVVNNFVSGLILLLERPIRTGDWIVVGSTEGYVKRISIRSTQIQTFDRADVIVPNSELIAGQVTNWMLGDPYGRVVLPVGVAYGSDTAKVKDVLLGVAQAHPLVLFDFEGVSDPSVIFRRFGDSSLDFELRCVIRDVDKRLSVLSDLNFAVDKAFRERGIEIPFPQRDVHVRDLRTRDSETSDNLGGPGEA
jgi:small-conductance mechanosensitive channel